MKESLAESESGEADATRFLFEPGGIVTRERNIEREQFVHRQWSAANASIVQGATMTRVHDQRVVHRRAKRFKRVKVIRIDVDLAAARARNLVRREMRPTGRVPWRETERSTVN